MASVLQLFLLSSLPVLDAARVTVQKHQQGKEESSQQEVKCETVSDIGCSPVDSVLRASGGKVENSWCKTWVNNSVCDVSLMKCVCPEGRCYDDGNIECAPRSYVTLDGEWLVDGKPMTVSPYSRRLMGIMYTGKAEFDNGGIAGFVRLLEYGRWKMKFKARYYYSVINDDTGDVEWTDEEGSTMYVWHPRRSLAALNKESVEGPTICKRTDDYVSRQDYVEYAQKHFLYRGRVEHIFQNLLRSSDIRASIPAAEELVGWNTADHRCMRGSNRRRSLAACELVDSTNRKMEDGEFNRFFMKDTGGSLCQVDEDFHRRLLGRQQMSALAAYSTDSGDHRSFYSELNRNLQNQTQLGSEYMQRTWSVFMYHFLGALDCLEAVNESDNQLLYRGLSVGSAAHRTHFLSEYSIGRSIIWTGVTSTTADIGVARTFAGTSKRAAVIFEITPAFAFPIWPFSLFPQEREHIMLPMSKFIVETVEIRNRVAYIGLKQEEDTILKSHCIRAGDYVY